MLRSARARSYVFSGIHVSTKSVLHPSSMSSLARCELKLMPGCADLCYHVYWRSPCPLLSQLITARCPSTTPKDASDRSSRSVIFDRRPQTGHLHSRRTANVRRQGPPRVATPKGEEGKDDATHRADDGRRSRRTSGCQCYPESGPNAVPQRATYRGCEHSPPHTLHPLSMLT